MKKFYSIRVIHAETKEEAIDKLIQGDLADDDKLCDIVVDLNELVKAAKEEREEWRTDTYEVLEFFAEDLDETILGKLKDRASFVDAHPDMDEFLVSLGSLEDFQAECGETGDSDGEAEAKHLLGLMGDRFSYLHII